MDGLKQRVIGALVLISLAVIFVPMLFDEPHTERSSNVIDLPEEPPFPEVQAPPESQSETASEEPAYRIEESEEADGGVADVDKAPASPELAESRPDTEAPAEEVANDDSTLVQAEPAAGQSEPVEAVKYADTLEGAWVVQLGSFGNTDNARRLRDKVREQGFDSHIQRVERGDTTLSRVFSGPFVDRSAAEKAKEKLDRQFDVNSLVTGGGE